MLASVLVASALLTSALNGLYGAGEGSFSEYPAHTLYGLTHRSNYRIVPRDFPDQSRFGTPQEFARHLYRKSFERLVERPEDFLAALLDNERKFLTKLPYNLAWLVSGRFFVASGPDTGDPVPPDNDLDLKTGLPLIALGLLSGLFLLARAHRTEQLFWVAATVGALSSIPFVYGDSGFRGLAVLYPFMTLGLTMGLTNARLPAILERARVEEGLRKGALWLGLGLLASALAVPAFVRNRWPRPPPESLRELVPNKTMVVSRATVTAVLVAQEARPGLEAVPRVTGTDAERLFRLGELKEAEALTAISGPYVLMAAYDFVSARLQYLIGPVELMRQGPGLFRLEVERLESTQDVFVVASVAPLPPPL